MNKRTILFLFLFLITINILSGCGNEEMNIESLEAIEDSNLKGSSPLNIDILNSDKYKEEIGIYIKNLHPDIDLNKANYEFGDLDGDLVPELILYIERDPEDLNDQGQLIVYKVEGSEYKELDRKDMNYDNSNYLIKIGKVSNDQVGVFLMNQVGLKAGVTYAYVVENNKLKSILNPLRINLISYNTLDTIEDIDGDGVVDFGILTIDPETEETNPLDAEKIILWYKWDGIDGGTFLRKDKLNEKSKILPRLGRQRDPINPGSEDFLEILSANRDVYSKLDLSSLLSSHIKILEMNASYHALDIAALFSKYTKATSLLNLIEDNNLSENRINEVSYLSRERVLDEEVDLKEMLIKNLNLGYSLSLDQGRYIYKPNYFMFSNEYTKSLNKELKGYLSIMTKFNDLPYLNKDKLLISKMDLGKRLVELENFRLTYPYSDHLENVNKLYNEYLRALLLNTKDGHLPLDSLVSEKDLNQLVDLINSYPETYFAQVVSDFQRALKENQGVLNLKIQDQVLESIR